MSGPNGRSKASTYTWIFDIFVTLMAFPSNRFTNEVHLSAQPHQPGVIFGSNDLSSEGPIKDLFVFPTLYVLLLSIDLRT